MRRNQGVHSCILSADIRPCIKVTAPPQQVLLKSVLPRSVVQIWRLIPVSLNWTMYIVQCKLKLSTAWHDLCYKDVCTAISSLAAENSLKCSVSIIVSIAHLWLSLNTLLYRASWNKKLNSRTQRWAQLCSITKLGNSQNLGLTVIWWENSRHGSFGPKKVPKTQKQALKSDIFSNWSLSAFRHIDKQNWPPGCPASSPQIELWSTKYPRFMNKIF